MRKKLTPARVASGTGVGSGRRDDTRDHSKNDANALARSTAGMSHEEFEDLFEDYQQAQEERHAGRRPGGAQ